MKQYYTSSITFLGFCCMPFKALLSIGERGKIKIFLSILSTTMGKKKFLGKGGGYNRPYVSMLLRL